MEIVFQGLVALFALIGLFGVFWRLILLCVGEKMKRESLRILVKVQDETDPVALMEDLQKLSYSLIFCRDLRLWLVCPKGGKQEKLCRYLAQQNPLVRVLAPEQLKDETKAFWEEL